MSAPQPNWQLRHVDYRPNRAADLVLRDVTVDIAAGEFTAILGPNGAGKSSLARVLLGMRRPERGTVLFREKPVTDWSKRDLARAIGVVAQAETFAFSLSVREMVAMGRYAWLGHWRQESEEDRRIIDKALAQCDVARFSERDVMSLSGGELARARIARALAQDPDTLLLDEPTAALDVAHEMAMFELLRDLRRNGMTVVLITHHINLAARYADRLIIVHEGRVAAVGDPPSVLTPHLVDRVWRWPMVLTTHAGPGRDTGATQVTPLARMPEGTALPVSYAHADDAIHFPPSVIPHDSIS